MINRECGVYKTTYQADLAFYRVPLARWTIGGVLLVALVLIPLFATEYWFSAIILPFLLFSIAVIGLNLLVGSCGQISLGHGALMAVGGYAATLIYMREFPFLLSVISGGIVAALVGLLFGIPSARIKGLYLAMATLAAQFALPWVISRLTPLFLPTGQGAVGGDTLFPPAPYILGLRIQSYPERYFVSLLFLIILTIVAMNLLRSRVGRAWIAVRDHDVAANILGFNITYYKLLAFTISSFYAGISGALLIFFYFGVAHVLEFGLNLSIELLAMVIIGGLGSMLGSFLGVAFILLLPIFLNQFLTFLGDAAGFYVSSGITAGVESLIFGALVIIFLVTEPLGLAKLWNNIKDYFRLWPFSY